MARRTKHSCGVCPAAADAGQLSTCCTRSRTAAAAAATDLEGLLASWLQTWVCFCLASRMYRVVFLVRSCFRSGGARCQGVRPAKG